MLSEMMKKWKKRKKGHFAIYTKGGKRFVVPLYYLNHPIFRVLLEMAEEEFGTAPHGPLQVPCEEEFMEFVLSLLRKNTSQQADDELHPMNSCKGASLFPIFHYSPSRCY